MVFVFKTGLNLEFFLFSFFIGMIKSERILRSKIITPPNLLGIDRRRAYANKKYHSGWICTGVVMGLAREKLSGSIRR